MAKKQNYAIALVFTSFIFLLGIMIGSEITSSRIEDLQIKLQEDFLSTQSFELELSILQRNNQSLCDYIKVRMPQIAREKAELGRRFDTGDIPESQALLLQDQFVISTVRFWLFSEIQEENCGIEQPKILFFADNSETSRQQGKVLDFLVFKSNETLTVFTFNAELFYKPLFKVIADINNIQETPTLIIGETKYEGFVSKDTLTEILCSSYNLSICE